MNGMPSEFSLPGDHSDIDDGYANRYLRPFVENGAARRLVECVQAKIDWLAWSAEWSYRHVNQFDKVVLAGSRHGRKLVWHRWNIPSPDSAGGGGELHNHRWDFVSYVVSGALEAVDYRTGRAAAEPGPNREHIDREHYVYHSPEGGRRYTMRHVGTARLREATRRRYTAGDFYLQPREVIHLAFPVQPDTSTLLVQGQVKSVTTDVDLPVAAGVGGSVQRGVARFDPSELRQMLGQLAARLPRGAL